MVHSRTRRENRRKICDAKVCQSKRIRDHSVARVNCRDARKRTRNHSRCLAIGVGHSPDKTIVASSTCAKITATPYQRRKRRAKPFSVADIRTRSVHLTWMKRNCTSFITRVLLFFISRWEGFMIPAVLPPAWSPQGDQAKHLYSSLIDSIFCRER